jgi:hypothetical protein
MPSNIIEPTIIAVVLRILLGIFSLYSAAVRDVLVSDQELYVF